MINVFISQPMRDKTNEQIETERENIIKLVSDEYPNDNIMVLDSFFVNAPHEAKPLWFLGRSITILSAADVAVFAPGWDKYRGCKIEHECAKSYGIKVIET